MNFNISNTVPGDDDGHRYVVRGRDGEPLTQGASIIDEDGNSTEIDCVQDAPWEPDTVTTIRTTAGVVNSADYGVSVELTPTAQTIVNAGHKYPAASYWTGMSGSDKDRWEDRKLRHIERFGSQGTYSPPQTDTQTPSATPTPGFTK